MKGATIAHAKQRIKNGRYIGITEPGIIGAEAPNPIVNELVIMPDIEKRLEAFVRCGHGVIVFPGGVVGRRDSVSSGHSATSGQRRPAVPGGVYRPPGKCGILRDDRQVHPYALGDEAASKYDIIIDDPVREPRP